MRYFLLLLLVCNCARAGMLDFLFSCVYPQPRKDSEVAPKTEFPPPPRQPLEPLPERPDPDRLPAAVLKRLIGKMANHSNWATVAYRASNHRTFEDTLRASWARDDLAAEIREYRALLTPRQNEIVDAAWKGGMAETPFYGSLPETVTLDWIKENFSDQ